MLANSLFQFKEFDEEGLIEFLSVPERIFYVTNTNCGKPHGVGETVYQTNSFHPIDDYNNNPYVDVIANYKGRITNSKWFIADMQNDPGKAVFSNREDAVKFYELSVKAFNNDPNWQAMHYRFKNLMRDF